MEFLFLCFVAFVGFVTGSCPSDWKEHGPSCYLFNFTRSTWTNSQDDCKKKEGFLAEIETKAESDFIENYAKRFTGLGFWAGGRDDVEGQWIWVNSGQRFNYTDWQPGQPDNAVNEDCLQIGGGNFYYLWNDMACDYKLPFVCEMNSMNTGPEVPVIG